MNAIYLSEILAVMQAAAESDWRVGLLSRFFAPGLQMTQSLVTPLEIALSRGHRVRYYLMDRLVPGPTPKRRASRAERKKRRARGRVPRTPPG